MSMSYQANVSARLPIRESSGALILADYRRGGHPGTAPRPEGILRKIALGEHVVRARENEVALSGFERLEP